MYIQPSWGTLVDLEVKIVIKEVLECNQLSLNAFWQLQTYQTFTSP